VDRLYTDLQARGIRCWYSPESLTIGAPQRAALGEAIHQHDKLLLVLSDGALRSSWVESEVETALERERKERRTILFPVRLDDEVLNSPLAWAGEVRRRHIGEFKDWKSHGAYQHSLGRLLRDLKAPS
jgi:TIR domain